MTRWEYAYIANPANGTDGVGFSHAQPDGIVQEFSAVLGRGLKADKSGTGFLHLNLNFVHPIVVAGQLGQRGWELVNHSVLTGGHEYYHFKRELPQQSA